MLFMASMMVFALGTMGASAAAKAPKNDKAVVVVSFGSTFDDTRTKDIGGIEEAVAKAFQIFVWKTSNQVQMQVDVFGFV